MNLIKNLLPVLSLAGFFSVAAASPVLAEIYILQGTTLLNVTNPSAPSRVGTGLPQFSSIAAGGGRIYGLQGSNLLDITNPADPNRIGTGLPSSNGMAGR